MIKISIIIPVYNVNGYLERCLDSILNQNFQDFEILLVNDGSSDGTQAICDEYAQRDNRIQVFHQKHLGVSAARNLAIPYACGKYTLFFDGDDFVEPGALQLLWDVATHSDPDGILYGYYFVPMEGKKKPHMPSFEKECYAGNEIIEQVIPKFIGVSNQDIEKWLRGDSHALKKENTALWRSMIRTSLIQENGILFSSRLRVGEDTCFTTEYLSLCKKVQIVKQMIYNLVERPTSTIYTYEQNALAVVQGKMNLLMERRELTERIKKRTGKDIETYWYGTVLMSIIQLAFLLSRHGNSISLRKGYHSLKKYAEQQETQKAIHKKLDYRGGGVRKIPFFMIRHGMLIPLFLCTGMLNLFGYSFER